ncbi:MAG: restriction endonuclease subunit S [Crocinitomicaceae bacterium]|nr:restriction endonuclease subunit S [Crocinitomicaceae bacterium]
MNKGWKEVELIEVAVIDTGFPFKSAKYSEEGELKVVRGKNVTEGNCRWGTDAKYWNQFEESLEKYLLAEEDIVIGMDGSKIGKNKAMITSNDLPSILAQRVGRVRAKSGISQGFLWQIINSNRFYQYIDLVKTGTSIPHMSLGQIGSFKFELPPLAEQKSIAHILGTLDHKIELNRKMNETLEQMAQALFKSWFVDFDPVFDNAIAKGNSIPDTLKQKSDRRKEVISSGKYKALSKEIMELFPSSFEFNEELEKWIPEGWEVKLLDQVIEIIGGGTPKTSIEEYWNGDIPWFSVVDAPRDEDVFVLNTEKTITELGVAKSSTKILEEGVTIISARGTVGKCAFVGFPMAMNQSCYGIKSALGSSRFNYYLLRKNVSDLQNKGHGSVFNTITRDTFKAINVVIPKSKSVLESFEEFSESYFSKIKSNLIQIETLTRQRDVLLPQLISGKLRVGEILTSIKL